MTIVRFRGEADDGIYGADRDDCYPGQTLSRFNDSENCVLWESIGKGIGEMSAKISGKSQAQTVALPLSPPLPRPGMLAYLVDAANLITLGGLAVSFFACWAVLLGRPSLAMALVALAIVIDNVDGWMARRTVGRNPALEHFGAHFDCYADYISKGIFPILYLLTATNLQVVSIPVALIYLVAIAVRYSYEFVPNRDHIGLSPDYLIVFLCLLQLAAPQLGSAFIPILMASLVGFAALTVAPFPSPKLKGGAVVGFCLFLLVLAAVLLAGDQGINWLTAEL